MAKKRPPNPNTVIQKSWEILGKQANTQRGLATEAILLLHPPAGYRQFCKGFVVNPTKTQTFTLGAACQIACGTDCMLH